MKVILERQQNQGRPAGRFVPALQSFLIGPRWSGPRTGDVAKQVAISVGGKPRTLDGKPKWYYLYHKTCATREVATLGSALACWREEMWCSRWNTSCNATSSRVGSSGGPWVRIHKK